MMVNKFIYDIFSFYRFFQFVEKEHTKCKDLVCIGIHSEIVDLNIYSSFKEYLFLQFDDVSREELCTRYNCISNRQIDQLIEFILKNKNEKFVIHCEAGISRSSAIAMCVTCILGYNGNKYWYLLDKDGIRNSTRFYPNMFVFDRVINRFNKKFRKTNNESYRSY